jgi:hypothetical protein
MVFLGLLLGTAVMIMSVYGYRYRMLVAIQPEGGTLTGACSPDIHHGFLLHGHFVTIPECLAGSAEKEKATADERKKENKESV